MAAILTAALSDLQGKDTLTDEDVLRLRKAVFDDGVVSIAEADKIFEIANGASQKCEAFGEFFMEVMTDFLVRQSLPYGYIDEANASWFIQRVSKDGLVESLTELKAMINILKTARSSSRRLVDFALAQVKEAVLNGQGVIGRGRALEAGRITAVDVEMLRQVMYACGGDDHIAITRAEAEVLFDLNDATRFANNDPEWQDLFVKGIANYLMFLSTYTTPSRDEVLRREKWLTSRGDLSLGSMIRNLKFKDIADAFTGGKAKNDEEDILSQQIKIAEHIDPQEAEWLKSRIGRDGQFDENEKALMTFLQEESPYLHVTLEPLLNAA